jgi:hypothetical protein
MATTEGTDLPHGDATKRSPTSRVRMLGVATSVIVTVLMLYAGELVLRVLRPDPAIAAIEAAEREGRPWDRRSRAEVVRDLRAQGVDAVPRTVPAKLLESTPDGSYHSRIVIDGREVLPLAGISRKTVVLCNETGEYAVYQSDEHGFRNPLGLWDRAPVDLVLLGDSFTVGECVPPGRDLGGQLRRHFSTTVNLGVGGHAPLLELAILEEYGPALRPRRVLWFYFENDLWWFDLGINKRAPLLMRYLEPGFRQGLLQMQPEIDARLTELAMSELREPGESSVDRMNEVRGSGLRHLLRFATLQKLRAAIGRLIRPPRSPAEREPADLALFESILARARDRTASWGGELVFVYLPGSWNFGRGVGWRPRDDRVRDRVLALAAALGLPVIDVQAALEEREDPLSLYAYPGTSILGPPHFNADGYAFVARLVLDSIGR